MIRHVSAIALFALIFTAAARADVLYTLVLTPTDGDVPAGTGSFLLNVPPAIDPSHPVDAFFSDYAPGQLPFNLEALTFTIGGDTFNLASPPVPGRGIPTIAFDNFGDFDYQYFFTSTYTSGPSPVLLNSFGLTGFEYQFQQLEGDHYITSDGYITVSSIETVPAPTPEPSSLALLGTGLAAGLMLLRRRTAGQA